MIDCTVIANKFAILCSELAKVIYPDANSARLDAYFHIMVLFYVVTRMNDSISAIPTSKLHDGHSVPRHAGP